MKQNPMEQFKEDILEYGGEVLWDNNFQSWTTNLQEETIAYLWGFIIYAQTKHGFIQPCWVAFEHEYSVHVQKFTMEADKYYVKSIGEHTHSVMRLNPRRLFPFLKQVRQTLTVSQVFAEVPDYRLFHFLNHIEFWKVKDDIETWIQIVLRKSKEANLKDYISSKQMKFVPEPQLFAI